MPENFDAMHAPFLTEAVVIEAAAAFEAAEEASSAALAWRCCAERAALQPWPDDHAPPFACVRPLVCHVLCAAHVTHVAWNVVLNLNLLCVCLRDHLMDEFHDFQKPNMV